MKKIGTMDLILILLAVAILAFTAIMIHCFYTTGGIPDTLCTCFFGICGGECGVMGWIKTNKDKQRDRKNQLEDQEVENKKNTSQKEIEREVEDNPE